MRTRWISALGTILLALAASAAVCAQSSSDPRHVDATQFGERVMLGPDWLFAPGDNPAWAASDLDDSGWTTLSTEKPLLDQGIRDISYAWYRIHIHLRPETHNLAIGIRSLNGAYEIYCNGVRVGAWGNMLRPQWIGLRSLLTYPVPDELVSSAGDLVVAIRVRINAAGDMGRGTSTPFGSYSVFLVSRESAAREASYLAAHLSAPPLLAGGLALVVCLISFALYFALPGNKEYLAVAVLLLSASLVAAQICWLGLVRDTAPAFIAMYVVLAVENFALIEFVRLVLHLRRTRWLLVLEIVSSLAFIFNGTEQLGLVSRYFYLVGFSVPILAVKIVLPVLLIRGWRHENREAILLFPAIFIGCFADYWNFLRQAAYLAHATALWPYLGFEVSIGSYEVDLWRIGDFAFYIALLLFLVLRTVRIARERARSAAELEAARTVQQVLIPEEIPKIPGFLLHSVYKPAGRVGGDFFQILAMKNGGVLAVIGDVSGKGMPAAMTVSLLVGTVRTLAHYTQSPGEILAAMNTRMLARSSGGFTTCLVLRADVDGTLTVANAGHIAPYAGGKELPLENGLPLGLSADAVYAESTFALVPGEQVTLLTDGVVEARDKTGALFGFDRTAALSTRPAEAIAQAAQAFGQDDDITALTLARTA